MVIAGDRSQVYAEEDGALVRSAAAAMAGDEQAFADLYSRLAGRIFNLVLRSVHDRPTAEDICQEVWLKAHREIARLQSPQAVRSWLFRIASNACIDFARSSRGKHRGDEDQIDDLLVSHAPQPDDAAILDSEVRFVWQSLAAMAPRQSIALYLKQVEGLSYAQIAAILGCEPQAVETLLFRARQSFARAYKRVESSASERCELFSQVMASIVDSEPTEIQRTALEAHSETCPSCRADLEAVRRANKKYLGLPFLPLGKGLALEALLAGGSATSGSAGLLATAAGIFGAGAMQAKLAFVGAALVAGSLLATGQVAVPDVSGNSTPEGYQAAAGAQPQTPAAVSSDPTASNPATNGPELPPPGPPGAVTSASGNAEDTTLAAAGPTTTNDPDSPTPSNRAEDPAQADPSLASENVPAAGPSPTATEPPTDDTGSTPSANPTTPPGPDADPPPDPTEEPANPPAQAAPDTTGLSGGTEASASQPGLLDPLLETTGNVTALAGQTVDGLLTATGDTVQQVVQPIATAVQPLDTAVENLTGLSVTETLQDVTGLLPTSDSTPTPLGETVQDVLEPVGTLLQDPLQPVEQMLNDPAGAVQDLTNGVLGLLQPAQAPSPQATLPPEETPAPTDTPPPQGPCLLGLLLC